MVSLLRLLALESLFCHIRGLTVGIPKSTPHIPASSPIAEVPYWLQHWIEILFEEFRYFSYLLFLFWPPDHWPSVGPSIISIAALVESALELPPWQSWSLFLRFWQSLHQTVMSDRVTLVPHPDYATSIQKESCCWTLHSTALENSVLFLVCQDLFDGVCYYCLSHVP